MKSDTECFTRDYWNVSLLHSLTHAKCTPLSDGMKTVLTLRANTTLKRIIVGISLFGEGSVLDT